MTIKQDLKTGSSAPLHGKEGKMVMRVLRFAFALAGLDMLTGLGNKVTNVLGNTFSKTLGNTASPVSKLMMKAPSFIAKPPRAGM